MKLIVDSGSTKTEWIFLDGERIENRVLTMGFNPNYSDMQTFEDMVIRDVPWRVSTKRNPIHSLLRHRLWYGEELPINKRGVAAPLARGGNQRHARPDGGMPRRAGSRARHSLHPRDGLQRLRL